MAYKEDIRIDETALDIELLRQPELVYKYGTMLADAQLNFSRKKENLDFVKAELDKKIRTYPEKFDLEKITEGAVAAAIQTSAKFKESNGELLEAKFEVDSLQVVVNSLRDKKDCLNDLVKLHGQQYFAGPSVPRNLIEERAEFQKNTNNKIGEKLSRRNKI